MISTCELPAVANVSPLAGARTSTATSTGPVARVRDEEFSHTGPIPGEELLARLRATLDEAAVVFGELDPARLAEPRRIQGFDTDGVGILVHVVEHFSYHTGQVTWRLKAGKDIVTDYYDEANRDLNVD